MKCGIALNLIGLAAAACISGCARSSDQCAINIAVGPHDLRWSLILTNATPRKISVNVAVMPIEDFQWELSSEGTVVLRGESAIKLGENPLIPMHPHLDGYLEIAPGASHQIDLNKYYPQLGDRMTIARADSLLWYCRTWESCSKTWIQQCGRLRLTNVFRD